MTFFAKTLKSLEQHRGLANHWHSDNGETAQTLVQIQDMSFQYGATEVLSDIQLQVRNGDCLAIIGPNGGGKTTLLRLIAGLEKPTQGSISVCGHDTPSSRPRIGYVPQQINVSQGFPITAQEIVLSGALRSGWFQPKPKTTEVEFAEAIMERLGLQDCRLQRMDQLSGGQQQRVLIARALMTSPSLLLFDEPTSNIDPEGRYCFHELMMELTGTITMIVVSHDLSILSSGVTAIAGVNQSLAYTTGITPTEPILALIYGQHTADCPMGSYLQDLQSFHAHHGHTHVESGHHHA